jgi:hypothetical protein
MACITESQCMQTQGKHGLFITLSYKHNGQPMFLDIYILFYVLFTTLKNLPVTKRMGMYLKVF